MRLTGRMAALSRFIAKSAEKSLPFFKVLRGEQGLLLGRRIEESIPEFEEPLAQLAHPSKACHGRNIIHVFCSQSNNCKCRNCQRRRKHTTTDIFCKQDLTRR